MIAVERICQPVLQQRVRQLRVAHTQAATCFGQGKGSLAHIFHSTGNNDFGVTAANGLGAQAHRFQAGTAQLVDSHGRNRLG
ncbi:hypothetical protein D3C85_1714740 [compost metagenome]